MATNYGLYYAVEITTLCIAVICFILRLSNRAINKVISFDDIMLLVATCFSIAMTALVWRLYYLGYGKTLDLIALEDAYTIGRIGLALLAMFPTCYSLIRISILLTYLKLFPSQTNRWLCWGLCGLQVAYSLWATIATLLHCRPIAHYGDKTPEEEACPSPRNLDIAVLTLNSFFDIIVYLWPVQYLYNLNLPFKSRLELIIGFTIGIVALGLSFARLSVLITMYSSEQFMRYGQAAFLMIIVESHVGIACASLPYLRFLFRFVSTNYLTRSGYGATKDRSKANTSNMNQRPRLHPFAELEGTSGAGIVIKTDIEMSALDIKRSDDDIPATIYGERSQAMEDQMLREERVWSGGPSLVEESDSRHLTEPSVKEASIEITRMKA